MFHATFVVDVAAVLLSSSFVADASPGQGCLLRFRPDQGGGGPLQFPAWSDGEGLQAQDYDTFEGS
eukprot:3326654-Lingulodinium_polyedra.AAC.1